MTPLNVKGFDMTPSKDAVEKAIESYSGDILAMNVLGGGAFSLLDSNRYLKTFYNIRHCVVGASSKNHLEELMNILGN